MNLNKYIDHTLLKPDATAAEIIKLCNEAIEFSFHSVCVNPSRVSLAYEMLKDTDIKIATVCGFPLGASSYDAKVYEAEKSCIDGASEIDMVINIGELKSGNTEFIEHEINAVADAVHKYHGLLKVIVETCLLSSSEKRMICEIVGNSKADFIKTSTGFNGSGAALEDIRLFRSILGDKCKIKASGGIVNKNFAISLIEAGATRLGCSSSIKIVS